MGTETLVDQPDELTADEARAFAEAQVQKYLGMSLDEFLERARLGTLPDKPVVAHLVLITGAPAAGFC